MTTTDPGLVWPATRNEPVREGKLAMWARALGSALLLVGAVVGLPTLLVAITPGLHLDPSVLTLDRLFGPDNGSLLLLVIYGIAWACWAVFASSVALEVVASARRLPTPRMPGMVGVQRLVAAIVAAITLALSTGTGGPAMAQAAPVTAVAQALPRAEAPASADVNSDAVTAPKVETSSASQVTVGRHDTLWLLAEQYLGDGRRFEEIVTLNQGVPQSDGAALGQDGRLHPGWVLKLPADAKLQAPRPDRHEVRAGETLWGIADDELGDPTRYPELYRANKGDVQPGGGHLADPDIIQPGWVLEMPDAEARSGDEKPSRDREPQQAGGEPTTSASANATASAEADPGSGATEPGAFSDPQASASLTTPTAGAAPTAAAPAAKPTGESSGTPATSEPTAGPSVAQTPESRASGSPTASASACEPSTAATQKPASAAPAPIATPSDSAPAASTPDSAAAPDLGVLLPTGGVVGGLLAFGFVAELARRRRAFQRHREPGERMATVGPEARDLEARALGGALETEAELLDAALTQLAANCWTAGRPLPDVRVAKLGRRELTLLLAADDAEAVAPFRAASPDRWELDIDQMTAVESDLPRAYPGLITLGLDAERLVLLNLESVGTLGVDGPPEQVANATRALAAELALGPVRSGTARTFCLDDAGLAGAVEAGEITFDPDADSVRGALTTHLDAVGRACHVASVADTRALRPDDILNVVVPEIVLTDRELGIDAGPWRGAAVITSAVGAVAPAKLTLDSEGGAVLQPGDHWLTVQQLAQREHDAIVATLHATDLAPASDPDPQAKILDFLREPAIASAPEVVDLRDADPKTEASPSTLTAPTVAFSLVVRESRSGLVDGALALSPVPMVLADREVVPDPAESPDAVTAPRILLLGEVMVRNPAGKVDPSRSSRLSEVAAFILLHPDARVSELQTALWPGQRSNANTCRQLVSRTRSFLGKTPDGSPYLLHMQDTNGRLRMREDVTSDWAEFQSLVCDDSDANSLRKALGMVRGRPFGTTSGRELPWADLAINEMIEEIADTAHRLYELEAAAGHWFEAREAALRGLLTEAESLGLLRDALTASKALGDLGAAAALERRMTDLG